MQFRIGWLLVALVFVALPSATKAVDARRPVLGALEGYDEYGPSCGDGQGTMLTSIGSGQIAHFGRAVLVSPVCVAPDYSVIGTWTFSISAADGDVVTGVITGWEFTDYGFDLFGTVTGGTGRFTGATGELTFPTVSSGTGVWSEDVEGWISY